MASRPFTQAVFQSMTATVTVVVEDSENIAVMVQRKDGQPVEPRYYERWDGTMDDQWNRQNILNGAEYVFFALYEQWPLGPCDTGSIRKVLRMLMTDEGQG